MTNSTQKERTLLMRGVDALSRREYSRQELARKLLASLSEGQSPLEVEEVLDILQARGYLSNERYASQRVRMRASRYGNRRLAYELAMQGVDRVAIEQALEDADSELERAKNLWKRKFGHPPEDRKERDRQIRFLCARGFDFDIIQRVIKANDIGWDE